MEKDNFTNEEILHAIRMREYGHKAAADFGLHGLKTLVLVNGGALIALVTFLQTIWKDMTVYGEKAGYALVFFSLGIILALIATLCGYVTMSKLSAIFTPTEDCIAHAESYERYRKAALYSSIASVLFFTVGVCAVYCLLRV